MVVKAELGWGSVDEVETLLGYVALRPAEEIDPQLKVCLLIIGHLHPLYQLDLSIQSLLNDVSWSAGSRLLSVLLRKFGPE
ncbi:MAG: hypothetical protein AAF085_11755, partial [Planctomycetota bacterium]